MRMTPLMKATEQRFGKSLPDLLLETLTETKSLRRAAAKLNLPAATLRDWCNRLGIEIETEVTITRK